MKTEGWKGQIRNHFFEQSFVILYLVGTHVRDEGVSESSGGYVHNRAMAED